MTEFRPPRPPRFYIDTGPKTDPAHVEALQARYAAEVLPVPYPTSTWRTYVWGPFLAFLGAFQEQPEVRQHWQSEALQREHLLIAAALKRQSPTLLGGEEALRVAQQQRPVRTPMRGPKRII